MSKREFTVTIFYIYLLRPKNKKCLFGFYHKKTV